MVGPGTPVSPMALATGAGLVRSHLRGAEVGIDPGLMKRLASACAQLEAGDQALADAGRDWWPLALQWARAGEVPALPAAVARPGDTAQVAAVLALCQEAGVPVTVTAGRSGVCGASVPVHGGLALDLCALAGVLDVDDQSLLVDVAAGTFGLPLEEELRQAHGLTLGHWPQSIALSTVGGWVACRSAGQYSTRYGKIEDMVAGLEVVLADGRVVHTGGSAPRASMGPDLSQCFLGSEGTLGVVTRALLRAHPVAPEERRGAWAFASFTEGLEACRRTLRRGATPAVLRLYDEVESERNFETEGGSCALIALDEGDPALVGAAMGVLAEECARAGANPLDEGLVGQWLGHRNEVSALGQLSEAGIVVDTVEVAARWATLPLLSQDVLNGLRGLKGTMAASVHQSHAYTDGACLYFTFAGRGRDPDDLTWAEAYYRQAWQGAMDTTLAHGAAVSHHHGIGLNRSPWLPPALGTGFEVLVALKAALDPAGILNPAKLGLPSPFGPPPWP